MTHSELKRFLKKNSCRKIREGSSHEEWINESNGRRFYVPRHSSKEMARGTVAAILKQAGLL